MEEKGLLSLEALIVLEYILLISFQGFLTASATFRRDIMSKKQKKNRFRTRDFWKKSYFFLPIEGCGEKSRDMEPVKKILKKLSI